MIRNTYGQLMTEEQKIAFGIVKQWADSLTNELTSRIIEEQARESIRVARVDNTSNVPNPQAGDIRFNLATSKFQGYTGSSWVDFIRSNYGSRWKLRTSSNANFIW